MSNRDIDSDSIIVHDGKNINLELVKPICQRITF